MILVLPAFAWFLLALLPLFAALVVVRMTFDLVGHAKSLARSIKRANGRLAEAAAEVRDGSAKATKRLEAMGRRSGGPRRRT